MTLNIELTPRSEEWINREAQLRGLQPADIIQRIIEEKAVAAPRRPKFKTPEEHIAAMEAVAVKSAIDALAQAESK